MTEREIIQKCKAYDKAAFMELVRVYSPSLMSVCLRYMGDKHFAEDMLQESFIRIFQNILTYQETGAFRSWMHKIAATTCLKEIRKKYLIADIEFVVNDHEPIVDLPLMNDESGIMKVLDELSMPYKLVFNLYVIEGYTHFEISEMLGISESTSRAQLSRARKMIQSLMIKHNIHLTAS